MNRIAVLVVAFAAARLPAAPPNVVLILTDDQGYGDLGCHGNPILKTPHIDAFAKQSVELTNFYVCPVCTPTRASLLTGRYHLRTGAIDTSFGRALMRSDEVTLAQLFAAAGYRTGLFGKWHLGDNYPLRPQDRGFQEVLRHHGGGIGQPSDPPGSSYFKPILDHNGKLELFDRYCSDVYTDAAIDFIAASKGKPFFAYVPYNCPHAPLQVQEKDVAPYQNLDLSPVVIRSTPETKNKTLSAANVAKLYGMVANIDANVGRLLAKLAEWNLARDTIVIFLTDNGPQEARFNANLRDLKGTAFDGGIRVPFFVRYPAKLAAGSQLTAPAAHIDLVPTLCTACGLTLPKDRVIDGIDLWPYLTGAAKQLPERDLFIQWHRGDAPELGRAYAVRGPRYKLVQPGGQGNQPLPADAKPMLFDMTADPFEKTDLAADKPDIAAGLRRKYEAWFTDVTKAGFTPVRISIGAPQENPVRLTRQDWRGPRSANWTGNGLGHWDVTVVAGGSYAVTLRFAKTKGPATLRLRLAGESRDAELPAGAETHTFASLQMPDGRRDATLEAWVESGGETIGVLDVEAKRQMR
ncbi:MAG: arylsulfatase [Gemmataceae bacterium]